MSLRVIAVDQVGRRRFIGTISGLASAIDRLRFLVPEEDRERLLSEAEYRHAVHLGLSYEESVLGVVRDYLRGLL